MDFQVITLRELPTWIKVYKRDGVTDPGEILQDLTLIDDLLTLQKSASLLTRKKNLKAQLEARIGYELGHATPNLNRR